MTDHGKCEKCGTELVLCPMCDGSDSYIADDEDDPAFWLCQNKDCDNYEYCCGC